MRDQVGAEEKLAAVVAGAKAIMSKESFTDSARAIFDRCCQMTGAVSGYVALLNDNGDENEVLFLEAGNMPCSVDPELPMPIRGLREQAYRTQKVACQNDFMNSEWVQFMPPGHVYLRNVMFAPLNLDGKTVGVIGIANKPQDFDDADAAIATVFGELAAIALKISRSMDLLNEKTRRLEKTISEVRTLHGLLPMCSHCKSIRNDKGYWTKLEKYLYDHSDATISHGLCPDCLKEFHPRVAKRDEELRKRQAAQTPPDQSAPASAGTETE